MQKLGLSFRPALADNQHAFACLSGPVSLALYLSKASHFKLLLGQALNVQKTKTPLNRTSMQLPDVFKEGVVSLAAYLAAYPPKSIKIQSTLGHYFATFHKAKSPENRLIMRFSGLLFGGGYWVRTNDFYRVKVALSR